MLIVLHSRGGSNAIFVFYCVNNESTYLLHITNACILFTTYDEKIIAHPWAEIFIHPMGRKGRFCEGLERVGKGVPLSAHNVAIFKQIEERDDMHLWRHKHIILKSRCKPSLNLLFTPSLLHLPADWLAIDQWPLFPHPPRIARWQPLFSSGHWQLAAVKVAVDGLKVALVFGQCGSEGS